MVQAAARSPQLRPDHEDFRTAFGELGLTTAFMFAVFTLVRWGIGTAGADATQAELRIRCGVVSMLVGLIIVGFVVSRPGRWTGAHMNPAITLALFVSGRTPARRVLPYLAAQTAGSVLAAALARLVWGAAMSDAPTRWAVVQPAPGWGGTAVALVEAAVLAVIVGVMCWVPEHRPAWPLPWLVGLMFGVQGAAFGTVTGGSANPARQLGPALFSGRTHLLAVYVLAPVAGGMLAAWVARHARRPTGSDVDPEPAGPTRECVETSPA
jgi:glycerol uptake facilitator-like aquaporin